MWISLVPVKSRTDSGMRKVASTEDFRRLVHS